MEGSRSKEATACASSSTVSSGLFEFASHWVVELGDCDVVDCFQRIGLNHPSDCRAGVGQVVLQAGGCIEVAQDSDFLHARRSVKRAFEPGAITVNQPAGAGNEVCALVSSEASCEPAGVKWLISTSNCSSVSTRAMLPLAA